ncbi:MAG: hypothetical protein K8S00_12840, partial [Bacteroidales bacterium]|nr:hypothetical protein [Bacteroidales bacterium]
MKTNYTRPLIRFWSIVSLFCILFISIESKAQTSADVKVFLQGPYITGSNMMRTDLIALDFFPTTQPYSAFPWDYYGTESIGTVPSNVVDWVLVELRDPYDTIVDLRAALLLDNGQVVDTNFLPGIGFKHVGPGNYYVVVKHRNHMPVMTALPLALPNATGYDFSDTTNFPPYGISSLAVIKLDPNVFGMIVGDINADCEVKYSGPGNDR